MTPDKMKLTAVRLVNIAPDFLGEFYIRGGDSDAFIVRADINYPAERILYGYALGRIIDEIVYLIFVVRKELSTQVNDPRRVVVGNPAAGRANDFITFMLTRSTIFMMPALVAENSAA
jgi:hypothetical protein